jgi:hypothetical protein
LTQHRQQALPVGVILIDGLAAIAARGHVVDGVSELLSSQKVDLQGEPVNGGKMPATKSESSLYF